MKQIIKDEEKLMMSTKLLPSALQAITERLNFPIHNHWKVGGFETYEIDLAEWNLSLTDANPCIWVKADDIEKLSPSLLAENLKDVVRERGWQNSTIILFVDGQPQSLRTHLPKALPTFIIIDDKQQTQIQNSNSPTSETLQILLSQMPRSQLAPYETNKPVVGNQFFGRRSEINKVLQHPDTNYLFIGIRRIGKTSLLKEIKRQMDHIDPPKNGQTRRLYVDCTVISSEEEFLQTLTFQLAPTELKLLMGRAAQSKRYQSMMFDRFYSMHGGPITFLIDELDRLLVHLSNHWDLFDALRAASSAGKARFIMAGFRQALDASTNQQSPFFNLATSIRLGRLKRSDIKDMIVGPMERLHIHIQNREGVINRINRETASLPNYVQFYCKTLLEQLDEKGGDTITEDDLRAIYENREFRDFILDTFMSNTEPFERVLVYALIAEDNDPTERQSYSQRRMDEILKKRHLNLKYEHIDRACRSLEIAGVFNQVGRDFEFAIPLFRRILRQTRDVEFLFEKTRDEVLTEKTLLL
ncbi:MAG: ATP-binding protein [Anaerolineae bacterium]|nr:ATP-binding protein [Anaerolineae bacterium]